MRSSSLAGFERHARDVGLPLTQVAQLLGYGELSKLTRAFRRWHGTSPRRWRSLQRCGVAAYATAD